MNAFWKEVGSGAEKVWAFWTKIKELDQQQFNAIPAAKRPEKYTEGNALDEFWSHKYLESQGKTLSVVEFRQEFKKIDANSDKNMGLLEFLIWEYKFTVDELMKRPQGGESGEVLKAQAMLAEVETRFKAAQAALDQASVTEAKAKSTKEQAVKSADEATKTAASAAAAAAEQQAAVDALKAQEDAHAAKTAELTAKAEAGGVSGMKAKNELAQHLSEDPLPLRKAKLTAEAAAKKTDKANLAAQAAKDAAEKDKRAAEEAAAAAEKDRISAETAVKEGEQALVDAEAYLAEQKAKGTGETHGTFWWLDREIAERKKYMPKTGTAKLIF
uniref:Calcium-regulated actin-bundling protein C-terminal domain-containing protein n=1 Tax=Arcella intermedia TaxID=1963864 RepID=A0A6B2L8S7_9EUKA